MLFVGKTMEKELILMVGPIGSGKTTLAESLMNDTSVRISQDEMGKKQHYTNFLQAVEEGVPRVIIDKMNFNKEQRKRYIDPARDFGYVITIMEMKTPLVDCHSRAMNRQGHPNIPEGDVETIDKVLNFFFENYEKPEDEEYDNYNEIE